MLRCLYLEGLEVSPHVITITQGEDLDRAERVTQMLGFSLVRGTSELPMELIPSETVAFVQVSSREEGVELIPQLLGSGRRATAFMVSNRPGEANGAVAVFPSADEDCLQQVLREHGQHMLWRHELLSTKGVPRCASGVIPDVGWDRAQQIARQIEQGVVPSRPA